jgi:hypothetical protein
MLSGDLFGLPMPDAGPDFAAALTVHIAAGLTRHRRPRRAFLAGS